MNEKQAAEASGDSNELPDAEDGDDGAARSG